MSFRQVAVPTLQNAFVRSAVVWSGRIDQRKAGPRRSPAFGDGLKLKLSEALKKVVAMLERGFELGELGIDLTLPVLQPLVGKKTRHAEHDGPTSTEAGENQRAYLQGVGPIHQHTSKDHEIAFRMPSAVGRLLCSNSSIWRMREFVARSRMDRQMPWPRRTTDGASFRSASRTS